MTRAYIIPLAGRQVRIPHTDGHLPAAGAYVDMSEPYWRSRQACGHVSPIEPPAITAGKAKVDAMAVLLRKAVAEAKAGDAVAAAEAFDAQASAIAAEAAELAEAMEPGESLAVEAYAVEQLTQLRAQLHTLATEAAAEHAAEHAATPPEAPASVPQPRKGRKG